MEDGDTVKKSIKYVWYVC